MSSASELISHFGLQVFQQWTDASAQSVIGWRNADRIPARKYLKVARMCVHYGLQKPPVSMFSFEPLVPAAPAPHRVAV